MEGDAAVDHHRLRAKLHLVVHVCSDELEDERLATDHGLVVAFDVGDGFFVLPAVVELIPQMIHVPVFIQCVA